MARLDRFEDFRFIGLRDSMTVFDCDDADQFKALERLVKAGNLVGRGLVQTFGPDTEAEAANRGFKPGA